MPDISYFIRLHVKMVFLASAKTLMVFAKTLKYNPLIIFTVSCINTTPGTVFTDNVRCGYWTECSGSGSNATVRVCPAGYRSNPVHGKEGMCESDSIGCPTPESSRMLTLSSGLHHTHACLNVAFGCVIPSSTSNSSHIWSKL